MFNTTHTGIVPKSNFAYNIHGPDLLIFYIPRGPTSYFQQDLRTVAVHSFIYEIKCQSFPIHVMLDFVLYAELPLPNPAWSLLCYEQCLWRSRKFPHGGRSQVRICVIMNARVSGSRREMPRYCTVGSYFGALKTFSGFDGLITQRSFIFDLF
jgi:hypothetical protein